MRLYCEEKTKQNELSKYALRYTFGKRDIRIKTKKKKDSSENELYSVCKEIGKPMKNKQPFFSSFFVGIFFFLSTRR